MVEELSKSFEDKRVLKETRGAVRDTKRSVWSKR